MKFEVGKKYYVKKGVEHLCLAVIESSIHGPVVLFENIKRYSPWWAYLQDIERGDHGEFKEVKEPVVHKIRVIFTKDKSDGFVRSFVESPDQRPYKIGDVCGRIGTHVVHIREVNYTENE